MTLLVMEEAISWSHTLLIALLGFSVVLTVLLLMVGVMYLFGVIFTREHKVNKTTAPSAISEDEVAAIITALKLYKSALHDIESEALTINRITRVYSPWNSKIHGLTQMPKHR